MGDGLPDEVKLLQSIDRFGVMAVMGRNVLSYGEITKMRYCENLRLIYNNRQRAENWAQWAKDNREQAAVLNEAERLYHGE